MNPFKCILLIALAASVAGCGKITALMAKPQEAAYRAYEKALASGDLAALEKTLAGDVKAELTGPDAAVKLEMIKAFRPTNVVVAAVHVTNDTATLEVTGDMQGQKAKAEVRMAKEGGAWKVVKEEWSISMELGASDFGGMALPPAESFMPDPKNPPAAQAVLEGHQGEVSDLAFTPDGSRLVSCSYGDYSVRLWDAGNGAQLAEKTMSGRIRGMVITPDGGTVLLAGVSLDVTALALEPSSFGESRTVVTDAGDEIAMSPDGKLLAATSYQKPVTIWSYPDGKAVKTLKDSDGARVLAFSPAGDVLVGAGDGNTYTVWKTKDWSGKSAKVSKVDAAGQATGVAISPDGKLLGIGFTDSSIVVIDLAKGKEIQNFFVADASTLAIAFSRDGSLMLTGNRKEIHLWEPKKAKRLGRLKEHEGDVYALAFSPEGATLASGSADRKVILWRVGAAAASTAGGSTPAAKSTAPAKKPAEKEKKAPAVVEGPLLELPGAKNLVRNPGANLGVTGWKRETDAEASAGAGGNPCLAVKYDGMFWQDVKLAAKAGSYVLVIARA
jgi:hypothetical protein